MLADAYIRDLGENEGRVGTKNQGSRTKDEVGPARYGAEDTTGKMADMRILPVFLFLMAAAASAQTTPPATMPAPPDVAAPPADATKTASGLFSKVIAPGKGTEVTLSFSDWQGVLAVQNLLARYLRAVAEPDTMEQ